MAGVGQESSAFLGEAPSKAVEAGAFGARFDGRACEKEPRRPDFRQLKESLAAKDAMVHSGYVYAGADPKADDIALKIGGLKGWPRWRGVGVFYLFTTFDLRLLNQAEGKKLSVSALIFGTSTHVNQTAESGLGEPSYDAVALDVVAAVRSSRIVSPARPHPCC
jgi:hypothetical protein